MPGTVLMASRVVFNVIVATSFLMTLGAVPLIH